MIFVIDDDPAVRDSLRVLLEATGHSVEDFPSAEAFLVSAVLSKGDCLIVADIQMVGMTGVELLELLRGSGNPIPVILITAQPTVAMAARARAAGALAVVEKPFKGADILRLIAANR